ncbi:MAG: HDIG domain-containing protein [Deltaproteobacteria bacterium]|nr:HDIG domain-containing protein [Deltaproteobacteria bacterium]
MKNGKRKKNIEHFFGLEEHFKWILLAVVTAAIVVVLFPSLIISQRSYMSGDVVERDIKATKDFLAEDKKATENQRAQAVEKILTVYDHDTALSSHLVQHVNKAFTDMRRVIAADATPKTDVGIPVDDGEKEPAAEASGPTEDRRDEKRTVHDLVVAEKPAFEKSMGITFSKGAFAVLEKEVFSADISDIIIHILSEILDNGVVADKELLLRESERGIRLRQVDGKTERTVVNLKQFYGLDQSMVMVRIIGQPLLKDVNYNLRNLIVDVVQRLMNPNIILNRNETGERRKKAASAVQPIFYKIKAGEMLLREGERASEIQLLKLKAFEAQTKTEAVLAKSVGAAIIILCLLVGLYVLYQGRLSKIPGTVNKNLLFIATMLLFFVFAAKMSASLSELLAAGTPFSISARAIFYGVPLAAGAMTLCLFMGLEIAIPFAIITAFCAATIFHGRFDIFIYFLLNSALAAYWVQNCRERKVFIKAGLKLGLLNIVLATASEVYAGNMSGVELMWGAAFALAGGVATGITTVGLAPLMEIAFGYATDITLLELANLDRPILRRLMIEAPGTYHHSMVVGNMVEAAASEIGANPLLAKVCGYYHDIGKIKKPLYFIENQTDGVNRHDKLAPSMSSLILIAHVKNGVEIARQHKLGQDIIDTIQQHHGKSLISYFYEKARKQKGDDAVKIEDFRYPGPRPQTREAGLVMLADVVEAASRTLENPTASRIQKLAQDLFNKIFSDGQLDNCELTLKDLHKIAKNYYKILTGIHHHRIEYSESTSRNNGKKSNGSTDRQPPGNASGNAGRARKESPGRLRRLGMS